LPRLLEYEEEVEESSFFPSELLHRNDHIPETKKTKKKTIVIIFLRLFPPVVPLAKRALCVLPLLLKNDRMMPPLSLSPFLLLKRFPKGKSEKKNRFLHLLLKEKSTRNAVLRCLLWPLRGVKERFNNNIETLRKHLLLSGGVFKRRDEFLGVKNPAVSLLFLRDCREFKSVPTLLSGTMRGQKRRGKEETCVRFSEFDVGRGFPRPRVRVGDEKREESDGGNHFEEE